MVGSELLELVSREISGGQAELAGCVKSLVSRQTNPVCELLDFRDDCSFMEPLLFTYFSTPETRVTLEQILYGQIDEGLRPAAVRAFVDDTGAICLPGLGYVLTDLSDREVTFARGASPGTYVVEEGGRPVTHTFEKILYVGDTGIELGARNDPLTNTLFRDLGGRAVGAEFEGLAPRLAQPLALAFRILKDIVPAYHDSIVAVTRRVVVYRNECLNSFASLSAHGAAFLETRGDENETFFIEDIVHQCGHIIFNAMTLDREAYFVVNPDRSLGKLAHDGDEDRSVYVAYHGIFTECLMCICLYRCYESRIFKGSKAHELLGRLAFILRRLYLDLLNMRQENLFTAKGLALYRMFEEVFDGVYKLIAEPVTQLNMGNQPYNFSYERFVERNPIDSAVAGL
jgi:hypothetical protein